jgi:hypothetical protein
MCQTETRNANAIPVHAMIPVREETSKEKEGKEGRKRMN